MIKWIRYDPQDGEVIEFCCDNMKSIYGKIITYTEENMYGVKVPRYHKIEDHENHKIRDEMIKPVQYDLSIIEYCPFCGKSIYNEFENRYDMRPPKKDRYDMK